MSNQAVVVGAGIAGLAMARALAIRKYKVRVIERNHRAVGASIRNFGMVWPIGQPEGSLYDAALSSAQVWKRFCVQAKIFHECSGSLHVAHRADEWEVLEELYDHYSPHRPIKILTPEKTAELSPAVRLDGLLGSLWSGDEVIVDPRQAIEALPGFLEEQYGVEFMWNTAVTGIERNRVHTGSLVIDCDLAVICSGVEFETLFPGLFESSGMTKCKLQMMRLVPQPEAWKMGPAICGGLSLTHYHSFRVAPSLERLKDRVARYMPEYVKWGIHVMASQNGLREITVGDSHEYGGTHDPFDRTQVNELILRYLDVFAKFPDMRIGQSWNGVYAKMTDGRPYLFEAALPGVYVFNGLGGAGMTLSFGVSEMLVDNL